MTNKIIINADDFGLTESCTKAIAAAFSENLISSTTACANGEYIKEAYLIAKDNGFSDKVGVHLNVTEGTPLTENIKSDPFFCKDGKFHGRINRLAKPDKSSLDNLREELFAQISRLKEIGFPISHADSHHHIHTDMFFIDTIAALLKEFGIKKIRLHRNMGKIKFYKVLGKKLYNRKLKKLGFITTDKMGSIEDIKYNPSIIKNSLCEIMVHPDYNRAGDLIDRIDFDENFGVGEKLSDINSLTGGLEKISYNEI